LDRRLGGPQSRSGHGREEKNSQPLSGLEPPIIQPVNQRYTTSGQGNYKFLPLQKESNTSTVHCEHTETESVTSCVVLS